MTAGNGVNALLLVVEGALLEAGLCAYIPAQLWERPELGMSMSTISPWTQVGDEPQC